MAQFGWQPNLAARDPSAAATPLGHALAELRAASEEMRHVDAASFALVAASLCDEPSKLNGAVVLLRATVTTELLAGLDWELLADSPSRDCVTPYGTPERARADFTEVARSNDAKLLSSLSEANQQQVRAKTDEMLAQAGVRRLRP